MLCDDERPQRGAKRVGFADQLAETIAAEIRVLGGVGDEAFLGKFTSNVSTASSRLTRW